MIDTASNRDDASDGIQIQELTAEVIAVGDELTSGQRLDTNSQWLSQRLSESGCRVAFHSTVGDDLQQMIDVIRIAINRADVVIMTGGLGPTMDDLTRQAIADAAGVELEFHEPVVERIKEMFARFGREMPETNRVQAYFPCGSSIIHNPEGTAPGIDYTASNSTQVCRIFALPGVPYEMKQMWDAHVGPAVAGMLAGDSVIHHHVLRCFGVGESQAESMLPDMMSRNRDPRVGITASHATISFRISTRGATREECLVRMAPTIREIRDTMGDIVFGENDQTLHGVVLQQLRQLGLSIGVADFHFGGRAVQLLLSDSADNEIAVAGNISIDRNVSEWIGSVKAAHPLTAAAMKASSEFSSDLGIAIGPLISNESDPETGTYHAAIYHAGSGRLKKLTHAGHSSMRDIRSAKHVLNFLRLYLLELDG